MVKKTIAKARRGKAEVAGDVCSVHDKKRKAEFLIDDGAGGMCCAPGDECKDKAEASAGGCKWCEQGECWSHGQIEKPEKKKGGRAGRTVDVDGDVCSTHGKSRKAEYLIDDGAGGMCCAPGDECKDKKDGAPRKGRQGKKDVGGDECSVHGKTRKAEFLIDDGAGGMCCAPGDECKEKGEGGASEGCKWCEQGECWTHGQIEKPDKKNHGGRTVVKPVRKGAKQTKGGWGNANAPSPEVLRAAMKLLQKGFGKGSGKGGRGRW